MKKRPRFLRDCDEISTNGCTNKFHFFCRQRTKKDLIYEKFLYLAESFSSQSRANKNQAGPADYYSYPSRVTRCGVCKAIYLCLCGPREICSGVVSVNTAIVLFLCTFLVLLSNYIKLLNYFAIIYYKLLLYYIYISFCSLPILHFFLSLRQIFFILFIQP